MKSIFRYPKTFVGIFILFALITVKYQNCAPVPEGSGDETNNSIGTQPFPTGTWNGQSGSVSSVNMSLGAMPSYIFPGSTVAVTVTVTGAGTLNVVAGANGNTSQGQGYFTNSCTCSGSASGSGGACTTTTGGTVILTCNVTPYGYNSGTPSGNTYVENVPIYATVEDGTQTTLQTCSSATGVCSGTYTISAPTLPVYYQVGNACYNLQYLGGTEFAMQASGQSTVYINSQYMEQYGFTDCSSGLCCDTNGRCFNTSGVYDNSYSPGTCF